MSQHPPEPPPVPPSHPPHSPDPRRRLAEGRKPEAPSALRRTIVRPTRPSPDPVDSAFVANRLTTLTHDLANLLDGSLRVVSLARRALTRAESRASGKEHIHDASPLGELSKQLDTLGAAMAQMADLVRASMMGQCGGNGTSLGNRMPFGSTSTLSEAVTHAVEVMRPIAEEKCIRIDLDIAPELETLGAGPIYTVVANAVRNSIEAIERRAAPAGGRVEVRAWLETGRTGRAVVLEVSDDGIGPPPAPRGTDAERDVFRPGFTTKPGGSGIGLAVSMDVVHQMGGTIGLSPRPDRDGRNGQGAVLRVCYPAPTRADGGAEGLAKAG